MAKKINWKFISNVKGDFHEKGKVDKQEHTVDAGNAGKRGGVSVDSKDHGRKGKDGKGLLVKNKSKNDDNRGDKGKPVGKRKSGNQKQKKTGR